MCPACVDVHGKTSQYTRIDHFWQKQYVPLIYVLSGNVIRCPLPVSSDISHCLCNVPARIPVERWKREEEHSVSELDRDFSVHGVIKSIRCFYASLPSFIEYENSMFIIKGAHKFYRRNYSRRYLGLLQAKIHLHILSIDDVGVRPKMNWDAPRECLSVISHGLWPNVPAANRNTCVSHAYNKYTIYIYTLF